MKIEAILISLFSFSCTAAAFTQPTSRDYLSRTFRSQLLSRNDPNSDVVFENTDNFNVKRRTFLTSTLATSTIGAASLLSPNAVLADDESNLEIYEDADCKFKISVPKGWEKSDQSLPDRRKIVFFVDPKTVSDADDKTLVFIAYTPVRDDFTSLSSFGSVDQVAQMTILPKGKIAGLDANESVMLNATSKNNAYYFDYTIKTENQPKRHFRSIFALAGGATGGAGSVLVTLTAQAPESKYNDVKTMFDAMISSYGKL